MSIASVTECLELGRRKMAMDELNRGRCYAGELMGLLQSMPSQAGSVRETVNKLLADVMQSITCTLEVLEPFRGLSEVGGQSPDSVNAVDHPAASEFTDWSGSYCKQGMNEKRKKSNVRERSLKARKGRRSHRPKSGVTETNMPHQDGYQWRKYGQKVILGCSFPREYFRCTYKEDQGCLATKQVQKINDGPRPLFTVTYYENHTCKVENDPPEKANDDEVLESCSTKPVWLMDFGSNSMRCIPGSSGDSVTSQVVPENQVTHSVEQQNHQVAAPMQQSSSLMEDQWFATASPIWPDFEYDGFCPGSAIG